MSDSLLDWLTEWYVAQCDGDWEHTYGVDIQNIDNPGWTLKIDLKGTRLDGKLFEKVRHNFDDDIDWWVCLVSDGQFVGHGGARNLQDLIRTFKNWADQPAS